MKTKLTCSILFLLLSLGVSKLKCQDLSTVYVHLPKQELAVKEYLQLIENSSDFRLTYYSSIIKERQLLLDFDSLSIKDVLDTLFFDQSIKYVIKGNLLILSPQDTKAYQNKSYKISGTVKNARNSKPIPFASVYVPEHSVGTICNFEGAFELYVPESLEADTIMISSIGFKNTTISATDFLVKPMDVFLNPDKYDINELIVRPENPRDLIYSAIEKKSKNYSSKPLLLTAFFREATKQNDNYISLSEAIIDIYKTSYTSSSDDLVKLKKGRHGSNTEASELVNMVVEGGLYNNMQLDIVKYGVSFLDPKDMSNYDFIMDKQITFANRQTYVIKFKFKENKDFVGFDGTIYLDAKTLAIVRCEFEISNGGLAYAREMMIRKTPPGFQVKPKFGKYEVEYRMYNDSWNLTHGRSEIGVKVKKKRGKKFKGYTCLFESTSEFVITGQETEGFQRIKYREASKPSDILYEQISSTDMEFWDNETIILPEEPLLKTIEKLKINERNEKAKLTSSKPSDK